MGYSIHDWFKDEALPVLLSAIEKIKTNEDDVSEYDIFMQALSQIFEKDNFNNTRKEDFKNSLVLAMSKEEGHDIFSSMKSYFNYLVCDEDKEILSLEYKSRCDKIRCEYNALEVLD
jgi:hypothetical protein